MIVNHKISKVLEKFTPRANLTTGKKGYNRFSRMASRISKKNRKRKLRLNNKKERIQEMLEAIKDTPSNKLRTSIKKKSVLKTISNLYSELVKEARRTHSFRNQPLIEFVYDYYL